MTTSADTSGWHTELARLQLRFNRSRELYHILWTTRDQEDWELCYAQVHPDQPMRSPEYTGSKPGQLVRPL